MITEEFIQTYLGKTIPWGYSGLGEVVFLRTYSRNKENGVKETWPEAIKRSINGAIEIGAQLSQDDAEKLFDHMYNLRCSLSGRGLWQLGTPLVSRFGGASLNNCYFVNIDDLESFEMLFNYLMLGGGVGFSIERSKIHELPKVKKDVVISHKRTNDADFIVPDSREGWVSLLHKVLESYFVTGKSFSYSTILIRGYGAELKTFGGTASGPEALIDGIAHICSILSDRESKKIRSVDALDVCNIIGEIVVSGSSRRSAQIAGGDPDDALFLKAKNWGSGTIPAWRGNSNNSIFADSWDEIPDALWKGYDGSGEPYGFLNRKLARSVGRLGEAKTDNSIEGYNPCAEIGLADGESCNLATIFLPNVTSLEQVKEISRLLYLVQKAITNLEYPYERTTKITRKNRRLGLNITGFAQLTEEQRSWINEAYEYIEAFDTEYSAANGIPKSVRLTTVQPGGTLPLLAGVLSATGVAHSEYFIRRVRFGSEDPLLIGLRARGHKTCYDIGLDGKEVRNRIVVEFPCKAPEGTPTRHTTTAISQLEAVKWAQTHWADNAVSCTVNYKAEELPEIKEWLKQNYDNSVKSVSFLLSEDHGFPLPPLEEITKEQYDQMVSKLDFSFPLLESSSDLLDLGCDNGACPVR